MSNNFDWKTEEDFDWDELPDDTPQNRPPNRRKGFLSILALIALIFSLAVVAVRLIERRVDENTQAMETDILSSHNLLQIAEAEQDDELFFSLLSGRDSSWTAAQHKLFQARALRDRQAFGLTLQEPAALPAEQEDAVAITFSPDLLTAEVQTSLPYEIEIGNGLTDTVALQLPTVYRLGRERWLLAPPDEEFWGERASRRGANVEISYPMRDEEIAQRLLLDLDRKLQELCATLQGVECARNTHLSIILSTDPQSLVDAARAYPAEPVDGGLRISMPAPSLVGIGADEAGYEALARGYAAHMTRSLIAREVGYECCEGLPFFLALVDYQLSQLALKPWPVREADYERVVTERVRLDDLASYWRSTDAQELYGPNGWRIYAFTDHLLHELPDADPATLQRELSRRGSFLGWINGLFTAQTDLRNWALLSELMRGFWLRGYAQALNVESQWQSKTPNQDLYLTCFAPPEEGDSSRASELHRYDSADNTWTREYQTADLLWITALTGDDLLLQQEFDFAQGRWAAGIRQEGRVQWLVTDPGSYTISFGQTDPSTTGVAAFVFPAQSEEATITWFDLQNCAASGSCEDRELPGIPIWSPDGRQALFTSEPSAQLNLLQTPSRTMLFSRRVNGDALPFYLADREEFLEGAPLVSSDSLRQKARGHAPFWIDGDTVGFVLDEPHPGQGRSNQVVSLELDQSTPQVLFTLDDLLAATDESVEGSRLYQIHYVMVGAHEPSVLYPVVLTELSEQALVFAYDRKSGTIEHLMSAGYSSNHSLGISPDGRYAVLTGNIIDDPNGGQESTLVQVYDRQRNEVFPFLSLSAGFPPFAIYDWSLDGQWLALLLDSNVVGFFAPEDRELQLAEMPAEDCGTPAWLNRP